MAQMAAGVLIVREPARRAPLQSALESALRLRTCRANAGVASPDRVLEKDVRYLAIQAFGGVGCVRDRALGRSMPISSSGVSCSNVFENGAGLLRQRHGTRSREVAGLVLRWALLGPLPHHRGA